MRKTANDYHRKNVTFDKDDPQEMKLFRELQRLPHGDFSKITKQMWEERLRKEERE